MINLEELALFLCVARWNSNYIDGVQLRDDFLRYMPRHSNHQALECSPSLVQSRHSAQFHRSSVEISRRTCRCHPEIDFMYLSHSFQSDTFGSVRILTMTDICPFESEFFHIITQSFRRLVCLHIFNNLPPQHTQQARPLVTFPRLRSLHVTRAHVGYATQFLGNEHCQLPRLQQLAITHVGDT